MTIEDIVNEAIVANELKDAVRVQFNNLPYISKRNTKKNRRRIY